MMTNVTLPAGVWLITFSLVAESTTTSTITRYAVYGFDSVTSPAQAHTLDTTTRVISTDGLSSTGSFTVSSSGTTYYNVACNITYSGGSMTFKTSGTFFSVVKRTRIA
jgi:hypothetical protein